MRLKLKDVSIRIELSAAPVSENERVFGELMIDGLVTSFYRELI
jgi:hypothetical protein